MYVLSCVPEVQTLIIEFNECKDLYFLRNLELNDSNCTDKNTQKIEDTKPLLENISLLITASKMTLSCYQRRILVVKSTEL